MKYSIATHNKKAPFLCIREGSFCYVSDCKFVTDQVSLVEKVKG